MFGLMNNVNFHDDETDTGFDCANDDNKTPEYDSLANVALSAETYGMRNTAWFVGQQLIEDITSGDLDEDELPSDRLDALIVGAVGDEEDSLNAQLLSAQVKDVFLSLGVDQKVVDNMFGNNVTTADAAIEAACETAQGNLPTDGKELDTFGQEFIYGYDGAENEEDLDTESDFDSAGKKRKPTATLGKATTRKNQFGQTLRYKGVKVIRHGEVKVINQRVPGQKVKMSAKQKSALKKASKKAHTAGALKSRLKSWKKGQKMGLNEGD